MHTRTRSWIKTTCLSLIVLSGSAVTSVLADTSPSLIDLGTGSNDASMPLNNGSCINSSGQILGQTSYAPASLTAPPVLHAFLYSKGNLIDIPPAPNSNATNTVPTALNDDGQALVQPNVGNAFVYDNGKYFTILPAMSFNLTNGSAINANGQVIGSMSPDGSGQSHAFLWDREKGTRDVGTLFPQGSSAASAVNDHGQVVGYSKSVDGTINAFMYDGAIHNLGTLPNDTSGQSMAVAINRDGTVIGTSGAYGFVWDKQHGMQDIGTLSTDPNNPGTCMPMAINSRGQILGVCNMPDGSMWAFLWTPHGKDGIPGNPRMKRLSIPNGISSSPSGLNDSGQVMGIATTMDGDMHAFLYSQGVTQDITLGLPTGLSSTPMAINATGQVVGFYSPDMFSTHPFVYDHGNFNDLGVLPSGNNSVANGINDKGIIAGSSNRNSEATSPQHAWVAGPVHH